MKDLFQISTAISEHDIPLIAVELVDYQPVPNNLALYSLTDAKKIGQFLIAASAVSKVLYNKTLKNKRGGIPQRKTNELHSDLAGICQEYGIERDLIQIEPIFGMHGVDKHLALGFKELTYRFFDFNEISQLGLELITASEQAAFEHIAYSMNGCDLNAIEWLKGARRRVALEQLLWIEAAL